MSALLLALLWGCGTEPAPEEISGLVECRGLAHSDAGWRTLRSALISYDPGTEYGASRCTLHLSRELTGGPVDMGAGNFQLVDVLPDLGWGWVYADQTWWQIDRGTMAFDRFDDTVADGSYTFEASALDADNSVTGRQATFEGPFSWCESTREDCPFRFGSRLEERAVIDTPVMLPTEAELTACQMVLDPATGALDVQLQIGVWRGTNVDQLWTTECGAFGTFPPQNNLFHFRAGGVAGPGSYGPHESWVLDGQRLPELAFDHPATFYGGLNATEACLFYPMTVQNRLTDGASCSFEVQPDRFALSCDGVSQVSGGAWPNTTGELVVEADCELFER